MSTEDLNENEEDFDFEDTEEEGFEDFQTESSSLGDMWRNNPMIKIGAVLAGLAAILAAVTLFGGGGEVQESRTPPAPNVTEAPGEDVSPTIQKAIEEKNRENLEQAQATGGSAIPTPVGAPRSAEDYQQETFANEDPLSRWREIQQQRLAEQQERQQAAEQRQQTIAMQRQTQQHRDQQLEQTINNLSSAMQGQMQQVIQEQENRGAQVLTVTNPQSFFGQGQQPMGQTQNISGGRPERAAFENQGIVRERLVPPGKIEYAQLLIEVNTDAPGPVLAQIVSGPLKGSRIIGSFTEQRDFLTLDFNQVVYNDQIITIDAVALDPETNTPGIISDIDRRYFSRVILPAAAEFISGFGEAVSEAGQTTVTVDGGAAVEETENLDTEEELASAASAAADQVAEFLDEEASQVRPMLKINAGTPMGIIFLEEVLEPCPEETVCPPESVSVSGNRQNPGMGSQQQMLMQQQAGAQRPSSQFVNPMLVNPALTNSGVNSNNQR